MLAVDEVLQAEDLSENIKEAKTSQIRFSCKGVKPKDSAISYDVRRHDLRWAGLNFTGSWSELGIYREFTQNFLMDQSYGIVSDNKCPQRFATFATLFLPRTSWSLHRPLHQRNYVNAQKVSQVPESTACSA